MKNVFSKDGKKIFYFSEWIQGKLWVHFNGKTISIETPEKKSRSRHEVVAQNRVIAPMPGKVTKVLVSEGQLITKGQAVVVMEAMKMEYTLKADLGGKIEKIMALSGSQVSLGDVLVKITEESK